MIELFVAEYKLRFRSFSTFFVHETGSKLLVTKFGNAPTFNKQVVVCNALLTVPNDPHT